MKKHPINWLFAGAIILPAIAIGYVSYQLQSIRILRSSQNTAVEDTTQHTDMLSSSYVVAPSTMEPEIADTVQKDSLHEKHFAWKPDTIPYLFGKPSARKIKEYKQFFEKLRQSEDYDFETLLFNPEDDDSASNILCCDLGLLYFNDKIKISKSMKTNLTLWRLNQFTPIQLDSGETEINRYDKFQRQINSAIKAMPFWHCYWESIEHWLSYYIPQNLYQERLMSILSNKTLKALLQAEIEASERYDWHQYKIAHFDSYSGVYATVNYVSNNVVETWQPLYLQSLLDFYFSLTTPDIYIPEQHWYVSDNAIRKAYTHAEELWSIPDIDESQCSEYKTYLNEGKTEYTVDTVRYQADIYRLFQTDRQLWRNWMRARARISNGLTGYVKAIYDNTTNNIKRHKLILLKNHFLNYTTPLNQQSNGSVLFFDCTDKELQNFVMTTTIH